MSHMKDLFLSTLGKIPSPWQGITPNYEAIGIDGKKMPTLQRDFLLGRVSSEKVIEIVDEWIKNNISEFSSQQNTVKEGKSAEILKKFIPDENDFRDFEHGCDFYSQVIEAINFALSSQQNTSEGKVSAIDFLESQFIIITTSKE